MMAASDSQLWRFRSYKFSGQSPHGIESNMSGISRHITLLITSALLVFSCCGSSTASELYYHYNHRLHLGESIVSVDIAGIGHNIIGGVFSPEGKYFCGVVIDSLIQEDLRLLDMPGIVEDLSPSLALPTFLIFDTRINAIIYQDTISYLSPAKFSIDEEFLFVPGGIDNVSKLIELSNGEIVRHIPTEASWFWGSSGQAFSALYRDDQFRLSTGILEDSLIRTIHHPFPPDSLKPLYGRDIEVINSLELFCRSQYKSSEEILLFHGDSLVFEKSFPRHCHYQKANNSIFIYVHADSANCGLFRLDLENYEFTLVTTCEDFEKKFTELDDELLWFPEMELISVVDSSVWFLLNTIPCESNNLFLYDLRSSELKQRTYKGCIWEPVGFLE